MTQYETNRYLHFVMEQNKISKGSPKIGLKGKTLCLSIDVL